MTAARLATCLLLAVAVLLGGCTALVPDHLTLSCERDVSETDGDHRQRGTTLKTGVSATYDLRTR